MPDYRSFGPSGAVDNAGRLAVLNSYGILDTAPEEGFDDVTLPPEMPSI